MNSIQHFINGEFVSDNNYLCGINPATEETIYQLANGDKTMVDKAVKAATAAFDSWSRTTVNERIDCLLQLAALIKENSEHLAYLESIDTGKPLTLTQTVDIPRAAANFEFFAQALSQYANQCYNGDNGLNIIQNQAIGPVACISPWNLPLYLLSWKIAPALAIGSTVVAKPSELTPLTANELAKLSLKADLPAGVLNIIHGEGASAGEALINHPLIKAVSFTGGTNTGKHIAQTLAPQLKKVSLELGGKNAAVIFSDCNYEKMLETTIRSSFSNQGQICLCTSRIFIEKKIYQQFKNDFVAKVKQLNLGNPLQEKTQLGSLISQQHQQKVSSMINQAVAAGATILCGGDSVTVDGKGYYHQATILEGLANDSDINQQEVFGPVVCLIPFECEKEVLAQVNHSDYGLAATIWTESLSRAHRFSQQIETGIVWVNCWMLRDLRTPFGGMKQSGVGREGGFEAMQFFTEKKTICFAGNN